MNPTWLNSHGEKKIIVYGHPSSTVHQLIDRLQTQTQASFDAAFDLTEIRDHPGRYAYDLILAYDACAQFNQQLFNFDLPVICLVEQADPSEVTRLIHHGAYAVAEADNLPYVLSFLDENTSDRHFYKPKSCIYHDIVNEFPLMICRFDAEYNLTFVNEAYCQWRQLSEADLLGTNILQRLPDNEQLRFKSHIAGLTLRHPTRTLTHQTVLDDGASQWIEWTDRALFDEHNNLIEFQSVGRDISEQMEVNQRLTSTEQALHTKENQLQLILDTMQDALISIELASRAVVYVSASFEEVFGYPYHRFVQEPEFFMEVVHPDDLQKAIEAQQRCMREGFVEFEHRIILPDGSLRWLLRHVWVNYDEKGTPIRINDSGRDITAQKRTQNLLEESEEIYRLTLSNISDAVFMTNEAGDFTFVCPNVETILEATQDEIWKMGNIAAIVDDVIFEPERLQKRGEITNIERQIVNKNGAVFDVLVNVKPINIKNSRVLYTIHDITDRKQAEQELRKSEARFEAFMENLPAIVFIKDKTHRLIYANSAYAQALRAPVDVVKGRLINEFRPDIVDIVEQEDEQILRTMQAYEFAYVDRETEGITRYWQIHKFPIVQQDNQVLIGAIGLDITDRITFQNSLKESEHRYRQMFELVQLPKMIIDSQTLRILDTNPAAVSFYGYSQEQLKTMSLPDLCDAQQPALEQKLERVIQGELDHCNLVQHLADGSQRDMEMYTGAVMWKDQQALYCIYVDISELNRARQALEKANQHLEQHVAERTAQLERVKNQLEAIFNNSGDGIVLLANDNTIQQANEACKKLFGFSNGQVIDGHLTDFIHPEDVGTVTAHLAEIRQSHSIEQIDIRVKRPDGYLNAEMSLSPILETGPQAAQITRNIVGIIRDVTERRKSQQALYNSEKLLRTIADNHPSYLSIIDRDYTVLFASGHEFHLRDLDANTFIGQTLLALIPDNAEWICQQLDRAFEGQELAFEVKIEDEYYYYRAVPLLHDDEQITRILLSIEKITERKEAEMKIAEERNLLRTIIDSVPDYIYVKDTQHHLILNNRAHMEAIGADSPEEAMGKTDFDLFPNEMASAFYANELKVFSDRVAVTTEEQTQNASGELIWGLTTRVPFLNLDGELIGLVGITHDITERKIAEIAIKENEARYRLLAENVNDMISRHAPDAAFLYATPSSVKITGYTPEELQGKSPYELIYPEDVPDVLMSHDTVLTVPEVYTVRYRFMLKNGDLRWVETNSHSIRNASGLVIEIISLTRDITERIRTENELKAISDRLQLATSAAGIGVWEWVIPSGELIWDAQMCYLYGLPVEQFGGDFEYWRRAVHPEDLDQAIHDLEESVFANTPFYSQFRIIRPDGTVRHIFAQANTYCEDKGTVQRLIGVNMDITDLKEAEAALRSALESEQEVSELKSRIVSVASHEFRTPLTAILAMTETLSRFRNRMDEKQIDDRLEKIAYQVHHMKGITEDMLQFTRLQSQEYQLNLRFGDMSVLCREITEEFNSQQEFENRVTYSSDPAHIMCSYDEKLMRQAVSNLVHNALKYSQKQVAMTLSIDETRLILEIKDQGIGIPEANLRHLFDPFYRANNVGSVSGTGLGLSVTKHAIQAHGGQINVSSKLGRGSVFTIFLPLSITGIKGDYGKNSSN